MPRSWTTLLAVAGFSLYTLAVFRPTASEVAHTVPAFQGQSHDALLLIWATSHVSRTWLRDPLHLFDAGIYYPVGSTLAYSDHMIGQAIVGLPIWLATGNPLLEYNLLSLASYALGAAAMFAYARALGVGVAGATAAGIVFAFTPFRFNSPLWLQVLCTAFMPLALRAFLRFVETLAWRDWAVLVACWTMHGLMGLYLAVYFAVVMAGLALHALLFAPTRRSVRLRLGLLGAPVVVFGLLAPTLLPYIALRGPQGHVRSGGLDTALSFFLPGPGTLTGFLAGLEGGVGQFGPGLLVWPLVLLGLVVGRARPATVALPPRFVWSSHVAGLVITTLLVLVPVHLQQLVPGLDMVRGTNRAFFAALPFLAMVTGWAIDWVASRRHGGLVAALVVLLLAVDVGHPPRERKRLPVEADLPPAHRWLRELPDTVVYERVHGPEPIALAMYYQIFHRKRLPIGYSGYTSPGTMYLNHRTFRFPAAESLHLLRTLGIRHALQHFPGPPLAEAAITARPRGVEVAARFGTDVVFRLDPDPAPPALAAHVEAVPRAGWDVSATLAPETTAALRDGDVATAWGGAVAVGEKPMLTVDLGTEHAIAGIRCVPVDPSDLGTFSAQALLSSDGADWNAVPAGFEPESLAVLLEDPYRLRFWEMRFPTRRARFVRFVNRDLAFWSGLWRIAELDVLEERAP